MQENVHNSNQINAVTITSEANGTVTILEKRLNLKDQNDCNILQDSFFSANKQLKEILPTILVVIPNSSDKHVYETKLSEALKSENITDIAIATVDEVIGHNNTTDEAALDGASKRTKRSECNNLNTYLVGSSFVAAGEVVLGVVFMPVTGGLSLAEGVVAAHITVGGAAGTGALLDKKCRSEEAFKKQQERERAGKKPKYDHDEDF